MEENAKLPLPGSAGSTSAPSRRGELPGAYPYHEDESANLLLTYGKILRKRRWTVLSVLLLILTVVLIATVRETPVYRATAMLEIQRENPNIVTVQELFQLPSISGDYLATQYRILRSDSLARQVIAQLHLDQTEEFNSSAGSWPSITKSAAAASGFAKLPTDPAHEQAVLARFENRLEIHPIRGSRLVEVSFDSRKPKRAAAVVNALTAAYIRGNLRDHWEATQQASAWLSQQLGGLKITLEKSEDRLQRYARANGLLFLESGKGKTQNIVDTRLRQLQNELTQAQADRYRKESLYRLAQAGDHAALPGVFDNRTTQQLTVKLADLEVRQAQLAPNFTASYPRMKEVQSQIDSIRRSLKQQRQQAALHLADEYLAALHRETLVRRAFDAQKREANLAAGKLVEYNILKRDVDTNKQLYQGLLRRLREAGVSAGLKASNIRVVDPAVPPVRPVEPRMLLSLVIASLVGLTFGAGLSLLQERLDNTLKTQQDVESFLRLPALALIPSRRSLPRETNGHRKFLPGLSSSSVENRVAAQSWEKTNDNAWVRIDSASLEHSALAEAFRGLRTSVLLSAASRPPRSLVVLSAEPAEGKTTICANLAIALAQLGKRVLLVEGDMRRPCLRALFHLPGERGMVHYLAGDEPWRPLAQPSGRDGLDCLACGPVPPNPSELLSSERMQALVTEAVAEYDFVLIDSPPLLNVADGRILATIAEGAILVAKGGATPRELVRRARLCLADVGAHLIGVVLNNVDLSRDGYDYPPYAGYGQQSGNGHRAERT